VGSVQAAVIVNPRAGAVRKFPSLLARMDDLVRGQALLCVTQDAAQIEPIARQLAREECAHVAIVGGDGTASHTLTAIAHAYGDSPLPTVSFLRGGTMNTIATALGVPRARPLGLLRTALYEWAQPAPRVKWRPTLRIGDRLGFLFGTGAFSGYLAAYNAAGKGHPTPLTAAQVFGHAVASALVGGDTYQRILSPTELSVRFEGGEWGPRTYITVCAGTVDQAGLGFRVFDRAFESDEHFQLLAVHGSPAQVAGDLGRIWTGRGFSPATALSTLTRWAEMRAAGSFGYSIDGDLFQAQGQVRLGLGPSFRFLLAH
jgi:diacylglycerol kinase family enzyme